ncbi:hypothetical protein KUCAC02_002670 [Chaenocephalus aceratus]|uniref:Uncharacterized protein n=1 Tax=Chaenocephalus aceratus TaxID=36190 RepID=A0ACB9XV09_CHAAC|nr:hypothetical protein KUCAC02_002670 [Chaenocephalus aceratus]
MQKLDEKCSELIQVVRKKGGAIRETTKLLPIVETVSEKEETGQILQQETISIFVIRDAQAAPKDIGIILKGQEVVNKWASVANAVA